MWIPCLQFVTPEDDIYGLPVARAYSKVCLSSLTLMPTPICADSPFSSSQMFLVLLSLTTASAFAKE
jgi:hypothetical protein